MNVRVGPTFEQCEECGAPSDGYGLIVHYAKCSKAPKGKRAKMWPTLMREEDLPDFLRDGFVHPANRDEAEE